MKRRNKTTNKIVPPQSRSPFNRRYHSILQQVVQLTLQQYERYSGTYIRQWGTRRPRSSELIPVGVQWLRKGSRVLDLGCGPGQNARYLHQRGFRPVGLDLSWTLLACARRHAPRLPFVRADMRRLPFRPNTFDGVFAAASLIHLPKPAVREVCLVLGQLVLGGGLLGATFVYGARSGYIRRGWIPGRYVSRWRKRELEQVVRCSGWDVLSLRIVTNRERKGRWLNLLARRPLV